MASVGVAEKRRREERELEESLKAAGGPAAALGQGGKAVARAWREEAREEKLKIEAPPEVVAQKAVKPAVASAKQALLEGEAMRVMGGDYASREAVMAERMRLETKAVELMERDIEEKETGEGKPKPFAAGRVRAVRAAQEKEKVRLKRPLTASEMVALEGTAGGSKVMVSGGRKGGVAAKVLLSTGKPGVKGAGMDEAVRKLKSLNRKLWK